MPPENQTRLPSAVIEHLDNERTLLAWIRLSIALGALGFVVARFGIFIVQLREITPTHTAEIGLSVPIGVLLVLSGPLIAVLALLRFLVAEREIEEGQLRRHHGLIFLLIGISVLTGLGLAVYLIAIAHAASGALAIP